MLTAPAQEDIVITASLKAKIPSNDLNNFLMELDDPVVPNVPRTRLSYLDLIRLTNIIRSLTDEIEGRCEKLESDGGNCFPDKFAALAVACKQAQLIARCALKENDSEEAKELAEMVQHYDE